MVGSAISPVIKVCANPETYRRLEDDMDVNAGGILEGDATVEDVSDAILFLGDASRQRSRNQVGSLGASGIHPHLQGLRADRSILPASVVGQRMW